MMMRAIKCLAFPAALFLSGCVSQWDMQGVDPKEYYAEHPIKNQVESRQLTHVLHFEDGESRLSPPEIDRMHDALRGVSMTAADAVMVEMSSADRRDESRRDYAARLLRSLGYDSRRARFASSPDLKRGDARLTIEYSAVVTPDCPDWRRSPVTTYSNTSQGNFRCATETNLGLMIADPKDLLHGPGAYDIDSPRAVKAIETYRGAAGAGAAGAASGAGSDTVDPSAAAEPAM